MSNNTYEFLIMPGLAYDDSKSLLELFGFSASSKNWLSTLLGLLSDYDPLLTLKFV